MSIAPGDLQLYLGTPTAWHKRSPRQLAGRFFSLRGRYCIGVNTFRDVGASMNVFLCAPKTATSSSGCSWRNFPCRFVANAVVQHLGSATTGGHGSDFCVFYGNRNVVWLTLKNFPFVLLPVAMFGHLAISGLLALQMLGRGQLGVFLRAKWAGLQQMTSAWRARETVRRTYPLGIGEKPIPALI